MKTLETAYLGLGANLGVREASLAEATRRIAATGGVHSVTSSALYETSPVGPVQPSFLNAVLEIRTSLSPEALLALALGTELAMGRDRGQDRPGDAPVKWGPRTIDIDILVYGDQRMKIPGLEIPHPELANRAFVLVPLLELAPGLRHPVSGVALSSLLEPLLSTQRVTLWKMAA